MIFDASLLPESWHSFKNCFDPERAIVPRLLINSSLVIPIPLSYSEEEEEEESKRRQKCEQLWKREFRKASQNANIFRKAAKIKPHLNNEQLIKFLRFQCNAQRAIGQLILFFIFASRMNDIPELFQCIACIWNQLTYEHFILRIQWVGYDFQEFSCFGFEFMFVDFTADIVWLLGCSWAECPEREASIWCRLSIETIECLEKME